MRVLSDVPLGVSRQQDVSKTLLSSPFVDDTIVHNKSTRYGCFFFLCVERPRTMVENTGAQLTLEKTGATLQRTAGENIRYSSGCSN